MALSDIPPNVYVTWHNGNWFVGDDDGEQIAIYQFTPAGVQTTVASGASLAGHTLSGIAVDSAGNFIVPDPTSGGLFSYSTATHLITPLAGPPNLGAQLSGVAVEPVTGHYIVASESAGVVYRVTPAGAVTVLTSGSPLINPTSLALIGPPNPIITTTSLPGGSLNSSYGPVTLTATGGSGSYTWSAAGLPSGIALLEREPECSPAPRLKQEALA